VLDTLTVGSWVDWRVVSAPKASTSVDELLLPEPSVSSSEAGYVLAPTVSGYLVQT
jgi:hypothetical protein